MVNEVRWADNDYGNPDLKELKPPVVISPKLYAGFVADRANRAETKSRGLSEGMLSLMSAALGYFVDYLLAEEETLKQK